MTCVDCPFYLRCMERRGLCRTFYQYRERVERTKQDIERINQSQGESRETSEAQIAANKGG